MLMLSSFGIGCFHFGVTKKIPFTFTGADYIESIEHFLLAISNIDKINIFCDEDFKKASFDVKNKLPKLNTGDGFFPHPNYMVIEFEVYIPFRIQAEMLDIKESFLETFTEKFKVKIDYTYYYPVTIIETLEPSQKSSPSDAVVIVRKFFEKESPKTESVDIAFESLGPSPFHADCFIRPADVKDKKYKTEMIFCKGYNEVYFDFNSVLFDDFEDAKIEIYNDIIDELGFFYSIINAKLEKMHLWSEIEEQTIELIELQTNKKYRIPFKKAFVLSKIINDIFIEITKFKANYISMQNSIQSDYRDIYSDIRSPSFENYIDKEIQNIIKYPLNETYELVNFIEDRRVKGIELLVVLISAILGGTIGSIITFYFSSSVSP